MNWEIETDESAEQRRRAGATDGRFQVCHPDAGLIDCADTLAEAFAIGDRYAARTLPDGKPFCATPFEVEVYDRMARNGQPRTWRRRPKNSTICIEHGDKGTMAAWWKCVSKRGLEPRTEDLTQMLW